jgi:hypothetical protein
MFVDYKRAFDSINRECIWNALRERGLPNKFINLIKEGYNHFSCRVLHNGQLSELFTTISGVRQGCLLSPLLLLVVLDGVLNNISGESPRNIVEINPNIGHKFRWIGHMLRKNDAEPSKAALQWNPQGIRKRVRPRNSWRRSTQSECGSRS